MDYPRKNTSGPRPPIALAVVKKRLLSFFDESEISDVNLLSKQDLYRCSLKPVVCLGVYSPDESESKDFAAAKTAKLKPASVGDVFGPSWVRNRPSTKQVCPLTLEILTVNTLVQS